MRSSEIRKSLNIEPLLLRIERSQLRWSGHVSRMPQERLLKHALHAKANGRRPVGRPRTRWTDYIEDLGWIPWDFAQAKWWRWWKTVRCGGSILSYCPRNPHGKAGNEERRRLFQYSSIVFDLHNMEPCDGLPAFQYVSYDATVG